MTLYAKRLLRFTVGKVFLNGENLIVLSYKMHSFNYPEV